MTGVISSKVVEQSGHSIEQSSGSHNEYIVEFSEADNPLLETKPQIKWKQNFTILTPNSSGGWVFIGGGEIRTLVLPLCDPLWHFLALI